MAFKKGDRVRLTAIVANDLMRRQKYVRTNWSTRTGTVHITGRYGVMVQWDDRVSLDQWPDKALELLAED